jgi:hypothetical protein
MANDIDQLRAKLFETMQGIKDGTVDVEKAKLISEIGQVIVNTAKVEIDYIRTTNRTQSQFFDALPHGPVKHPETGEVLQDGYTGVRVHRLKG